MLGALRERRPRVAPLERLVGVAPASTVWPAFRMRCCTDLPLAVRPAGGGELAGSPAGLPP